MPHWLTVWYYENYQTIRLVNAILLFIILVGWTITLRWLWDDWTWFVRWVTLSLISVWGVLLANTWDARKTDDPPSFRVGTFFVVIIFHAACGAVSQWNNMHNQPTKE